MNFKKINFLSSFNLAVFMILLLVGLVLFSDHFKFGLNQDISRVLFYNNLYLSSINIYSLTAHFIQPYSGQYLLTFILSLIFGYEAKWYFLTSFILRLIAAFSIYLLAKFIFENKFIGLAASLMFIVSYTGIQSSIPVISPAYLSIALMSLGLIKLFTYFQQTKKKIFDKTLVKSYFWLFLAFVIAPFSMHGMIFLIPVILISAALLKINKIFHSAIQIILFFLIVLLIKRLGFTDTAGTAREISNHLLSIAYFLKIQNPIKTILYPLTSFYQMIFLPEVNPLHAYIITPIFSGLMLRNTLTFLMVLLLATLPTILLVLKKKGSVLGLFILFILWMVFVFALRTIYSDSLSGDGIMLLLGGLITFFISNLIVVLARTRKDEALLLITFLFWPFSFSLIPHLAYPGIYQETTSRYLTVSGVGITFLVIYLFLMGTDFAVRIIKSKVRKFELSHSLLKTIILIIFFGIILITNFKATRGYFRSEGEKGNYRKYIDKYFEVMNKEIGDRSEKKRPVVYVESDSVDFTFLFVSIIDASGERFSVLNNNLSENVMPFIVASYDQLSAIYCNKNDKNLNPYSLRPGLDDIFAFKVDREQILVETTKIRESLLKLGKNYKVCPQPLVR